MKEYLKEFDEKPTCQRISCKLIQISRIIFIPRRKQNKYAILSLFIHLGEELKEKNSRRKKYRRHMRDNAR